MINLSVLTSSFTVFAISRRDDFVETILLLIGCFSRVGELDMHFLDGLLKILCPFF